MPKKIITFSAAGLVTLFLFTRLYHLTLLPIFTDESIYIYWAKIIATTHSQFFISLTDGKPPLLEWMITFFLWILPQKSYLLAGRLPAVISGLISLVGICFLSFELFEKKSVALVSALFYIVFPFTLLYDRLALFDSLLQAMLLISAVFVVKTAKQPRVLYSVLWGVFLGLAFFAKPTAIIYLVLFPVAAILLHLSQKKRDWKRFIGYAVLATVIGEGINSIQRISKVYFMMVEKNAQFQQPLNELFKNPFALTWGNLHGFYAWVVGYYTWPFLLIGIAAFIYLLITSWNKGLILLMLWFIPILGFATVGREIFPRYILFISPYFLIAVSAFLFGLYNFFGKFRWVVGVLGLSLVIPFITTDYYLLTNPPKAQIPSADSGQLVTFQSSGYGLPEIFRCIHQQIAKGGHVYVVTQGTFGDYPYAFNLEFWGNPNVTILPRWPLGSLDEQINNLYKQHQKVYLVFKENAPLPADIPLDVVLKVPKPGGGSPVYLTTIKKGYQP